MQLIYTDENRLLVNNAYNILCHQGFEVQLRNEFSSAAMGEIPSFDSWLEIWAEDDTADQARKFLDSALKETKGSPWLCPNCQEQNDANFEICWQCSDPGPDDGQLLA